MIATVLMSLSAAIVLLLGTIHLYYTFVGTKLTPRNPALRARMQDDAPVLTDHTSMWQAWVGFNASHSMGAKLFGLVYGYLALAAPELLFASWFLKITGLAMLAGLLLVGLRYWFRIPNTGIALSLVCYVAALAFGV